MENNPVVEVITNPQGAGFFLWIATEAGISFLTVLIVWLIVKWRKAALSESEKTKIALATPFVAALLSYLGLVVFQVEAWNVDVFLQYVVAGVMALIGSQAAYNFVVKPLAKQVARNESGNMALPPNTPSGGGS